jgi:hypothetical protein
MLTNLSRLLCHTALGLAVMACLAQAAVAQTDHINLEEGLPTRLEDAYPTAYRNREVQFFTRYERTREGEDRVTLNPRAEFSLARNWQFKVAAPFYTGSADRTGSGNVRMEAFYNFNVESLYVPAFALVGGVEFPSGKDSAGVDTTAKAILTQTISNRLDRLHLNAEITHNAGRMLDERSTRFTGVFGYSGRLGPDTILITDIVRQQERRRGENSNIIEVGIRRQLSPLMVLSVGAGAGVGDQSPKVLITIGIQRTLTY